jgi:predicted acylesterase/phospholipase RssA
MSVQPKQRAQAILAASMPLPEAAELAALIQQLFQQQLFGLASRVLALAFQQQSRARPQDLTALALARRDIAQRHGPNHAARHSDSSSLLSLIQQQALATYKDSSLPPKQRHAQALALLGQIGLNHPALSNSETLALGGAVYKRLWEESGLSDDLQHALALYLAGWERNPQDPDSAYCADQAAFILDLLAHRQSADITRDTARDTTRDSTHDGTDTTHNAATQARATLYRQQAQQLRQSALAEMARRQQLWPHMFQQDVYAMLTLANLQLGIGLRQPSLLPTATASFQAVHDLIHSNHADTASAVGAAGPAGPAGPAYPGRLPQEWAIQEVFKQAMALTRLHHYLPPELSSSGTDAACGNWHQVAPIFQALLGKDSHAAHTCHRGKVGLALSGGGFRAAFYHIGVMTRLAEIDALRSIEVLSTVSGGSVLGAHYYLELQHLLQSKADQDLNQKDYISLMQRLQTDFLAGVQRNITVRMNASYRANWRMTKNDYSDSHYVGELYEAELYSRVQDQHTPGTARTMPELIIRPANQPDFNPRYDNWRRTNKVPILLLNTTSFNTGHNWHFTATWMGEPPGLLKNDVDATERYRRLYYHEAPTEELQKFRLGHAVAASSCVPGIFQAVTIGQLYPGREVHLYDGGVHDNQGLAGLLDENCTRILCSDASGQMAEELSPTKNFLGVSMRANSVLQTRIRGVQYMDVRVRADNQALQGLFFVHLKHKLQSPPINWIDCSEPAQDGNQTEADHCTPYGIDRELQKSLAAIRTDLDSFTEVEANALMLSGYLTSEYEFKQLQQQHKQQGLPGTWGGYQIDAPRGNWGFLQLAPIMCRRANPQDEQRTELGKQLQVASIMYFKVWHLNSKLQNLAKTTGAVVLLALLYFFWQNWNQPVAPILGQVTWATALALAILPGVLMSIGPIKRLLMPKTSSPGWFQKAIYGIFAATLAKIHLAFFEELFLQQGKLERLLKMKGPPDQGHP